MAGRVEDLDRRDRMRRIVLRADLRQAREDQGLSQRQLAERLGIDQPGVGRYERGDQWKITTVLRWARALSSRVVLRPSGFPPAGRSMYWGKNADIEGALNDILGTVHVSDPDRDDEWAVAKLLSELAGVRAACGVSQKRLAARLGISEQSVSLFEGADHGTSVAMAQRYTRALGLESGRKGLLNVALEPAPVPEVEDAAVPAP